MALLNEIRFVQDGDTVWRGIPAAPRLLPVIPQGPKRAGGTASETPVGCAPAPGRLSQVVRTLAGQVFQLPFLVSVQALSNHDRSETIALLVQEPCQGHLRCQRLSRCPCLVSFPASGLAREPRPAA